MSRRRILTELEKLEKQIEEGKEMVFFQDIIVAVGVDTQGIVAKAATLRAKLMQSIIAKQENKDGSK